PLLGHGNRLAPGCPNLIDKKQPRVLDSEHRDGSAAGIHRKEDGVILAERQRPLRAQGGSQAAAAPAEGLVPLAARQVTRSVPSVGDDFILVGGVRHHEHGPGSVRTLSGSENREHGADSRSYHPKAASGFSHYFLLN